MTLVTITEVRENLPELLRRAAAGEQIIITEGDQWLAALGKAPPAPPTAEELACQQARIKAAIREMVRQQIEAGNPPPDGSKIWEIMAEEECR